MRVPARSRAADQLSGAAGTRPQGTGTTTAAVSPLHSTEYSVLKGKEFLKKYKMKNEFATKEKTIQKIMAVSYLNRNS